MSTQAQITANQANAQHSTGPQSDEGKAASSQNNRRYGFTGVFHVLRWEVQEDFDELFANLRLEHKPDTLFELTLVQKMAQHFWLAQRAMFLQHTCFHAELPQCTLEKQLALYLRYQTTHDRAFSKCADDLRKLRNERRKVEIGFESQKQMQAQQARREAAELRKQADERRKQEMHDARLRAIESQTAEREIDNEIRQTVEAPLPGHVRVPFETLKDTFKLAVNEVNRQLKVQEAA